MLDWLSSNLVVLVCGAGAVAFVGTLLWLDEKFDDLKAFRCTSAEARGLSFKSMPSGQIGRRSYRGTLKYSLGEDAVYLRESRFPSPARFYRIPYRNLGLVTDSRDWNLQVFTMTGTLNASVGDEFCKELRGYVNRGK
jgi:hypothetical protein